jgi:hypothetical protein
MTSSAAGPSAAPSSGERPSWVEAFFAATPGEKMSDDDIHTCELVHPSGFHARSS